MMLKRLAASARAMAKTDMRFTRAIAGTVAVAFAVLGLNLGDRRSRRGGDLRWRLASVRRH
jgi:hypothetical protein